MKRIWKRWESQKVLEGFVLSFVQNHQVYFRFPFSFYFFFFIPFPLTFFFFSETRNGDFVIC